MLAVGRKPVVQYVVEELARSGIERILFITSNGKSSIEAHFDIDEQLIQYLRETGREPNLAELDYERQNIEFFYTRQRRQLGLGHAVLCAQPLIGGEPAVVALGDSIIRGDGGSNIVERMTSVFESENADAVIAIEEVAPDQVNQYGIVTVANPDSEFLTLTGAVEKPALDSTPSNLSIAARYVFSSTVYDALQRVEPDTNGLIQLTAAIELLIQDGAKVIGVKLGEQTQRYDIGGFASYFKTFIDFALTDPEFGAPLRQHVQSILTNNELEG
jgi:UTP--glucose-1-phosphate uridylyltransferase